MEVEIKKEKNGLLDQITLVFTEFDHNAILNKAKSALSNNKKAVFIVTVLSFFLFVTLVLTSTKCDDSFKLFANGSLSIPPPQLELLKQEWQQDYQARTPFEIPAMDGPPKTDTSEDPKTVQPVECLLNDDVTVSCLQDTVQKDQIYIPYDFVVNNFEIYGEIKHYDAYDRVELVHTHVKHQPLSFKNYSYFGAYLNYDEYDIGYRNGVKCVTGVEAVPVSSRWGNKEIFYPSEVAEFGLSHFTKHLNADPPERMIYENGEDEKSLANWKCVSSECSAEIVYDQEQRNGVMKFSTPDSVAFGKGWTLNLGNTMENALSFDIKFTSASSLTVALTTNDKYKIYKLHYTTDSATVHFDGELNVYYGLGNGKEWHHVSRNLLLDLRNGVSILKQNKSSISIQKVSTITLRGSGLIDNITIARHEHMKHFKYAVDWLVENQDHTTGGWPNGFEKQLQDLDLIPKGWLSSTAQGQAISALTRASHTFQDISYIKSLSRALLPFLVSIEKGGVRTMFLDKLTWYAMYPTTPSLFVLNGFIYCLIGLYDFKTLLEDQYYLNSGLPSSEIINRFRDIDVDITKTYRYVSALYDDGMGSLSTLMPLFDGGTRSFYDLRHFSVKSQPQLAQWDDHRVHLNQLEILMSISNDPVFKRFYNVWTGYIKGKSAPENTHLYT